MTYSLILRRTLLAAGAAAPAHAAGTVWDRVASC